MQLPRERAFRDQFVNDQPWGAYNYYQGDNHSLIQVNTDLPIDIDRAVVYGCHEGYPGHHVQGISAERLYRERGWVEYSIMPLFSPQGPLNEGGGDYGVELAFPGDERLAFERDTLYPLAGLDPVNGRPASSCSARWKSLKASRCTDRSRCISMARSIARARSS